MIELTKKIFLFRYRTIRLFLVNEMSFLSFTNIQDPLHAAQLCLKEWGERDIPIQPRVIAKVIGVHIEPAPLNHLLARFIPANHAKNASSKHPTIFIESSLSETQERFVIAHALGHHCLNHGFMEDTNESHRRSVQDPKQQKANHFALHLLLPEHEVQRVLEHKIASSIEGFTRLFGVSEAALMSQFHNLGYFERLTKK